MANREYACAQCLGTFEPVWTDEEADQEAKDNFGVENASSRDDFVVVCEDCYNAMKGLFS